jgi:hypothetical protein
VYFITEILSWWTNSDLRHRLVGRVREYAGVTGCLLQVGIQLDPSDGFAFNKFPGTADSNMTKAAVEFHNGECLSQIC